MISKKYDFSQFKTVVEVIDNANKPVLIDILNENPAINGLIFGQTHIIDELKQFDYLKEFKDRCRITTGNYFTYMPMGFNIYIANYLFDNMIDQQIITFLGNLYKSTEQYARLIILTNEKSRPLPAFNEIFKTANFLTTNIIEITESVNLLEVLRL